MKVDGKFRAIVTKADGTEIDSDDIIVLRARDNATPSTLHHYRMECVLLGAEVEHIAAIDALIQRADAWRSQNPELCKIPDTVGRELISHEELWSDDRVSESQGEEAAEDNHPPGFSESDLTGD